MPSIQSAADQWTSDNPDLAAFLAGADYAQGIPTYDGTADVITDFNSAARGLKTGDPQADPRLRPVEPRGDRRLRRAGHDCDRNGASPRRNPRSGIRRGEALAGWLFTAPVILILGVFLLIPVLMALWVSVSDWSGRGSPFSANVGFVGLQNYAAVTTGGGLADARLRHRPCATTPGTWFSSCRCRPRCRSSSRCSSTARSSAAAGSSAPRSTSRP